MIFRELVKREILYCIYFHEANGAIIILFFIAITTISALLPFFPFFLFYKSNHCQKESRISLRRIILLKGNIKFMEVCHQIAKLQNLGVLSRRMWKHLNVMELVLLRNIWLSKFLREIFSKIHNKIHVTFYFLLDRQTPPNPIHSFTPAKLQKKSPLAW